MVDKRYSLLLAGLGLAAASIMPVMGSHARNAEHPHNEEWGEALARDIKTQVKAGLAEAAVDMEYGAEEMLRAADEMEAYADRLEGDDAFREREAVRQNKGREMKVTAEHLLAKAPEMRRGAEKMREGAEKMRAGAEKMRRGEDR
ncbi:hypothetical protein [Parasphingorhabdus sp.]|uniref:hypothetical protein n=1 Tax=Parasphingorhabdus sp. TaxID=2709688 RepID=UPI003A8CCF6A